MFFSAQWKYANGEAAIIYLNVMLHFLYSIRHPARHNYNEWIDTRSNSFTCIWTRCSFSCLLKAHTCFEMHFRPAAPKVKVHPPGFTACLQTLDAVFSHRPVLRALMKSWDVVIWTCTDGPQQAAASSPKINHLVQKRSVYT